jgi:addiction module HigA family antidote
MYNPSHSGEFIREVYLEPLGISYRTIAAKLKVAPSTFSRLIRGQSNMSSAMALRLSKTLGCSPESWLITQNNFNLWQAKQKINLDEVEELAIA